MEVRRIPPCPDYDIRGTEHWLEDMALQGYRLCEGHAFQYGFAYFIKEQPRAIRYRLVPVEKIPQRLFSPNAYPEEPDEETLQFHADFGWKYCTDRGQFWIFSCDDPAAPELNTDPRVQAIALETVEKRLRSHLLSFLLYGLFMLAPGHRMMFFSTLLWAGWYAHVPKLLFLAAVLLAWLPGLVHIVRFRRKLKQGIFPEQHSAYSPAKTFALQALRFSVLAIWFVSSLILMPDYTKAGEGLTPAAASELPCLTVQELFPEAEVQYISNSNWIYQWDTDAAPSCLTLQEHFRLTLPDGSTTTGVWSLKRFETTASWIAAGSARENRFVYWLRGGTTSLDGAVEKADWSSVFHVDNDKRYSMTFDVVEVQKGNVVIEAYLKLYDEFPIQYTPEELGTLLVEKEG